jgi:hypothetical protein
MFPLLFRGFKGAVAPSSPRKFLTCENGLRSILREGVTNAEKPLTLSQFIEKLQHFEISFDGKKNNA